MGLRALFSSLLEMLGSMIEELQELEEEVSLE